jgi:transcriptional regulator NrdR family protein
MSACPVCGYRKTRVMLTDQLRNGWTRRRRQCGHCHARWNSYELPQTELDLSGYAPGDLAIVPRGGHAE